MFPGIRGKSGFLMGLCHRGLSLLSGRPAELQILLHLWPTVTLSLITWRVHARLDPECSGFNQGFLTFRGCMNFNTALPWKNKQIHTTIRFLNKQRKKINLCVLCDSEAMARALHLAGWAYALHKKTPSSAYPYTILGALKAAAALVQSCPSPQ